MRGRPDGWIGAADYHEWRAALAEVVNDELAALRRTSTSSCARARARSPRSTCAGPTSPTWGLAAAAGIGVLVVGDIDRGGVLAHLIGTMAALSDDDQRLVAGFVVNKFRGARSILQPGLDALADRTGRPTLGVLPYLDDLWLDAEDSLSSPIGRPVGPSTLRRGRPPVGRRDPSAAPVELHRPRGSRLRTRCVDVRWVDDIASVTTADLAVLPGTRATVDDLAWLRSRGPTRHCASAPGGGGPSSGSAAGIRCRGRPSSTASSPDGPGTARE